jgi:hypothetical protein
VEGLATFRSAQFDGGLLSENIAWRGGLDLSNAKFSRKVIFRRTQLGAHVQEAPSNPTRINIERARLLDGLEFDAVEIKGELIIRRPAGILMLEVNEATISGVLPVLDRAQFEDPGEVNRFKWHPSLEHVIANTVGGRSQEERREASDRLRKLAEFADIARDLSNRERLFTHASELAPEAVYGSAIARAVTTWLLGRRREDVGRAAAVLLLLSGLVFPALYVAIHKHVTTGVGLTFSLDDFARPCADGDGNVVAAAIYASLRSTLFAIPDTEDRARQAAECLYGKKAAVLATSWPAFVPISQAALSGILLFAIGFAVRRRLSHR